MASFLFTARKGLEPIIVGKPHQPLLDVVHDAYVFPSPQTVSSNDRSLSRLKFDPKRTIMVGDRLATDILFGKRGGVSTLLVLTGSTKLEDLESLPVGEEPDYVTGSVGDILSCQ